MTNVFGTAVPTNVDGSVAAPKGILTRFTVDANGLMTGYRVYSTPTMDATDLYLCLYGPTGTVLDEGYHTVDTAVGWHTYALAAPVALTAGAAYTLVMGKETGTLSYAYALAALPITANGITMSATAVRSGAGGVWAEYQATITETDNYYADIEIGTALSVNAGADQACFVGGTVSLTAVASGGSGAPSYTWTKVNGPAGTFSTTTAAATVFTPSTVGTYTLRAIATDGTGSAQDDVVITVTTAPTLVPLATINSSTGWTPTGGTVQGVLADTDDATLITSVDNPTDVLLDGTLGAIAKPSAEQNLTVRVRGRRVGATSGSITGRLYEGATLRSTVTASLPSALADVDLVFPAAEISVIPASAWTAGLRLTLSVTAAV